MIINGEKKKVGKHCPYLPFPQRPFCKSFPLLVPQLPATAPFSRAPPPSSCEAPKTRKGTAPAGCIKAKDLSGSFWNLQPCGLLCLALPDQSAPHLKPFHLEFPRKDTLPYPPLPLKSYLDWQSSTFGSNTTSLKPSSAGST